MTGWLWVRLLHGEAAAADVPVLYWSALVSQLPLSAVTSFLSLSLSLFYVRYCLFFFFSFHRSHPFIRSWKSIPEGEKTGIRNDLRPIARHHRHQHPQLDKELLDTTCVSQYKFERCATAYLCFSVLPWWCNIRLRSWCSPIPSLYFRTRLSSARDNSSRSTNTLVSPPSRRPWIFVYKIRNAH